MILGNKILRGTGFAGGGGPSDSILDTDHPDLLIMYTMDNISGTTLVDESPAGKNAVINGTVPAVSGLIGDALDFSASDGTYVNLDNKTTYDIIHSLNDFSVSLWFRLDVFVSTADTLWGSTPAATAEIGACLFVLNDGSLRYTIMKGTSGFPGQDRTSATGLVSLNTWHHCVLNGHGVVTGNELFLDSVSLGILPLLNTPLTSNPATRDMHMARANHTSVFLPMDGKLDQFRFFNRPLTQTEVNALYNGGAGA